MRILDARMVPTTVRPRGVAHRARRVTDADVAAALDRAADLLEVGGASSHRVRAYRAGADAVRTLDRPIDEVAAEGHDALVALPHIGDRLARAIEEIVGHGTFGLLVRLEGETAPEELLTTVPGIGPVLARRIHERLGIETLEELELAVHDGRLATLEGLGPRRVRGLGDTLDAMLRRAGRRRGSAFHAEGAEPMVGPDQQTLLGVDAEYRRLAAQGRLRKIAPRRFNPGRSAWLPIWHTERDGWDMDVLFSNTARAHQLGKTQDWVVIHFSRGGHEGQCTVVTGRRGERIVRGLPTVRDPGTPGDET